jgi:hypothetical protein
MPAICIDARRAKAALDMAANKTDGNDAGGLAYLAQAMPEMISWRRANARSAALIAAVTASICSICCSICRSI